MLEGQTVVLAVHGDGAVKLGPEGLQALEDLGFSTYIKPHRRRRRRRDKYVPSCPNPDTNEKCVLFASEPLVYVVRKGDLTSRQKKKGFDSGAASKAGLRMEIALGCSNSKPSNVQSNAPTTNVPTTAAPTDGWPPRYYRMPQGSADCEFNSERIQTEADCRAALDVLAPACSSMKTSSSMDALHVPRCCSQRPDHCGNHDWLWNSASTTSCDTQVGSGRSDIGPICKRKHRIQAALYDSIVQASTVAIPGMRSTSTLGHDNNQETFWYQNWPPRLRLSQSVAWCCRFTAGSSSAIWDVELEGATSVMEVRITVGPAAPRKLTLLISSDSVTWSEFITWEWLRGNEEKRLLLFEPFAATSVRLLLAGAATLSGLDALSLSEVQVYGCLLQATASLPEEYVYSWPMTPMLTTMTPSQGSTVGGTLIKLAGMFLDGKTFGDANLSQAISVTLCDIPCNITAVAADFVSCETGAYGATDTEFPGHCPVILTFRGFGRTLGSHIYQYVDAWSSTSTWGGFDPPSEDETVVIPKGATVLLDISPPRLFSE